ncbi:MAG: hypothetical protein PF549_03090 [Patescibacteria group bacterium]|jgi:hypothetical protein|nr:hypothetical protein [Patescibacteria group bacterium]
MKKELRRRIKATMNAMSGIIETLNRKWDNILFSVYKALAVKLESDRKALAML